MRKYLFLLVLSGLFGTPAFANGMGDPSANTRMINALCDAQRRGERPPYPNMCLPEIPPDYPSARPRDANK